MWQALNGGPPARNVEPGRGIQWWRDAWGLFTRQAGPWVLLGLLTLVALIVLSAVPLLGALAAALLAPVLVAGWMAAARKAAGGGTVVVDDLFAGFRSDKLTPLLTLGALLLAGTLLLSALAGVLGVGAVMGSVMGSGNLAGAMAALGSALLAMLIVLALGAFAAMALWFAPALVMFRGTPPLDALKASIGASLTNWLPFLLYSLLYLVASVVASIPFGLGWVVLVPVLMLTVYTSYQDVFG